MEKVGDQNKKRTDFNKLFELKDISSNQKLDWRQDSLGSISQSYNEDNPDSSDLKVRNDGLIVPTEEWKLQDEDKHQLSQVNNTHEELIFKKGVFKDERHFQTPKSNGNV